MKLDRLRVRTARLRALWNVLTCERAFVYTERGRECKGLCLHATATTLARAERTADLARGAQAAGEEARALIEAFSADAP